MKFFSGFCLQNESELFECFLKKSDFVVAGFSYGAIRALEYTLNTNKRVDRLILLSPAFFNDKKTSFKRAQLLYFQKDKQKYIKNFLKNAASGLDFDFKKYFKDGSLDELKELLYYNWDKQKIEKLINKGVVIEVFLGGEDKIINANSALEFFKDLTTTYFIKRANHILKEV
jgi:pimeloyl-ACP methyl ester carboxylesterase